MCLVLSATLSNFELGKARYQVSYKLALYSNISITSIALFIVGLLAVAKKPRVPIIRVCTKKALLYFKLSTANVGQTGKSRTAIALSAVASRARLIPHEIRRVFSVGSARNALCKMERLQGRVPLLFGAQGRFLSR